MGARSFVPTFLYYQLFITPQLPTTDCASKTIIVTGANVGLGKEAARHFVKMGAEKLIMAVRSLDKGEAAKKEIESTTGRKGVIEVWQVDLQSYESVKEFAKRAEQLKRLDVLIENAGISTRKFKLVAGNESTITTNVVSTFLMALLMLPKLQQTGREQNSTPTLTIVSSDVHFFTTFPERKNKSIFGTLNDKSQSDMADRYNVSKLLEVLVCREIAREHPVSQTKVTLNLVTPGFCHSELQRNFEGLQKYVVAAVKAVTGRSTEVGSRTLVSAGLAGPETHGKFLMNCEIKKCSQLVEGAEGPVLQKRLWSELSKQLNEIEPGVTKNLDN